MRHIKKLDLIVFGGILFAVGIAIAFAWATNSDDEPQLSQYKKGDIVYLKPDSLTATVLGTGNRYYIVTRPEWRSSISVREFEIYGIKE